MLRRATLVLVLTVTACRTAPDGNKGGGNADTAAEDADGDGFPAGEDCDDEDAAVNAGAPEVCDGVDNDCDGDIDEGVTNTWYADADGDSYGDPDAAVEACSAPEDTVASATDCDDTDPAVHPAAAETCNGIDDNCDGEVDEGLLTTFYTDADGDGYGDPDGTFDACEGPDNGVDNADDCDDTDPDAYPGAPEVCDGVDNDCDNRIDTDAQDAATWYADVDGDGYGDPDSTVHACEIPTSYVDQARDCDDADFDVNPDADEVCDGIDNDCDGATDDADADVDTSTGSTWFTDADTDGYGDAAAPVSACVQPSGTVSDATDCDDTTSAVSPAATEVCNSVDDDCDGDIDDADSSVDLSTGSTWYDDADTDGYGDASATTRSCSQPSGTVADATDCDDTTSAVSPGASEVCNGIDDDCDGDVDDADSSVDLSTGSTWYDDADTDGYGDASVSTQACSQPSGTVSDATDCNDAAASINPGATEVCNSVDDDCDGDVDDDDSSLDLSTASTWYADSDADGYGDLSRTTDACSEPSGYTSDTSDCDDTDASINPGATDTWYDGIDADCAGDDDYDADGDGESPYAYGGTDCDDDDASVNQAAGNCRAACTPPSTSTLASRDPSGVSDLQFDEDCNAWVTTLISGTDYVYRIDSAGTQTIYTGASNHNIGSIALDPSGTGFAVSYNNVGYLGVSSSASIPVVATGGYASGTNFSNGYLREAASSMAWDSSGRIWMPNFGASGVLKRFTASGTGTTVTTMSGYIESVALDINEDLYVSVGATVYRVSAAGSTSTYFTLPNTVLDMVFDITGELYVLTTANQIIVVDAGGTGSSTFATVGSEGKLAISPDGTLYHLDSQPTGAASYQSWAL